MAGVSKRTPYQHFAVRLSETARKAGATNPGELGEQLALLLDWRASVRGVFELGPDAGKGGDVIIVERINTA